MITSLPTFTQEDLIAGTRQDLEQRLQILAQLLKDTTRDRDHLVRQNRQLRIDNDTLEDDARHWKEQAAQNQQPENFDAADRIRELEATLREERISRADKEMRQQKVDEARRRILRLPNTKMGSSDKLVALDYLEQAAARFYEIHDLITPFTTVMEHMAERIGLSPSQLTRINKTQKKAKAWNYDVERTFVRQEGKKKIYQCEVTVALDKIITDPNGIEKPVGKSGAHQGGARERRCKHCGSDDLDRVAVEYCRNCKKSDIQMLPGLRSDCNTDEIIASIKQDEFTIQDHLYDYTHPDDEDSDEEAHHIFTSEDLAEMDAELAPDTNEQKHDAFIQPELTAAPEEENVSLPGQDDDHCQSTDLAQQIDQEIIAFTKQFVQQPEIQPVLAELGKAMAEQNQRYEEAVRIIEDLDTIGYQLEYSTDGRRLHKIDDATPTASRTVLQDLKERIVAYDTQVQEVLRDFAEGSELLAQASQIEPKHDAFQHTTQLAEEPSNMQDQVRNIVSLHVVNGCSCCIGIEKGPKPIGTCWQCGYRCWRWSHKSPHAHLNQRWICNHCAMKEK
jgi:hypothetical protein